MDRDVVITCVLLVLLLCWVAMGPAITIWSLNVVFQTEIPLNWNTWIATHWLLLVLNTFRIGSQRS